LYNFRGWGEHDCLQVRTEFCHFYSNPKANTYPISLKKAKVQDVMLPTEQIYAAIFREHGFQDVRIREIRKRTSKKELFEFVVSAQA
jgi:hypothetical protein